MLGYWSYTHAPLFWNPSGRNFVIFSEFLFFSLENFRCCCCADFEGGRMSFDLMLKSSCSGCGSTSDLYGSNCKHMTLCLTCGKTMAENRGKCYDCGATVNRLIRVQSLSLSRSHIFVFICRCVYLCLCILYESIHVWFSYWLWTHYKA